jgi:hypothetical protein
MPVLDVEPSRRRTAAGVVALTGAGLALSAAQLEGREQALTLLLGGLATVAVVLAVFQDRRRAAVLLVIAVALGTAAFVNIWTAGADVDSGSAERGRTAPAELPAGSATAAASPAASSSPGATTDPATDPPEAVPTPARGRLELNFLGSEPAVFEGLTIEVKYPRQPDFLRFTGATGTCISDIGERESVAIPDAGSWYRVTLLDLDLQFGDVVLDAEHLIGRRRPRATAVCTPV